MTAKETLARIERLLGKLVRMESDFRRALSEYSHSAAATDRTRIACEQARHATAEAKERAMDKSRRQEAAALDHLNEQIATPIPPEWDRVVEQLAALGVTGDWHSIGAAGHRLTDVRNYDLHLSLVRRCQREGKECPWVWLSPVAFFGRSLRSVPTVGEIVAQVEAVLATKPDQPITSVERYDVSGIAA